MSDDRLREMREAFDRIFASPPPPAAAARESFLAVRLGGDRYALRLTVLSGLERRPRYSPCRLVSLRSTSRHGLWLYRRQWYDRWGQVRIADFWNRFRESRAAVVYFTSKPSIVQMPTRDDARRRGALSRGVGN